MIEKKKYTLKQLRSLKEMSREELAELTNLHYNTILKYENDVDSFRKSSYETLEKIANALSVSVDDIFLGSNSV